MAGQAWALQKGVVGFNQQAVIALSNEQIRAYAVNLHAQAERFAQQLAALQGNSSASQPAPDPAATSPEHRVARVEVQEREDSGGELAFDRGLDADLARQADLTDPSLNDPQRALLDVPDPLDFDADPNDVADYTDREPSAVVEGQEDGPAEAVQPIASNTPDGAEVGTDTTEAPKTEAGESPYTQSSSGIVDAPGGDRPSATTYRESQTQSDTLPVNEATEQIDTLRRVEEERDAEEQAAALRRTPARVEIGRGGRARQNDQGWINLKRDAVQRLTAAQLQLLQSYPAEIQDQVFLGIVAADQLMIAADTAAMANVVQDSELRSLLQQISAFATQQQQQARELMATVTQP